MAPLTYRITTLGCRVNHAEAREIESILLYRGLFPAQKDQRADLEVVHTCSVTNSAAAKSRHAIRKAARRGRGNSSIPNSTSVSTLDGMHHEATPLGSMEPQVLVTGCYVSTNPNEAKDLSSPRMTLPQTSDDLVPFIVRFAERLDACLSRKNGSPPLLRHTSKGSSANSILPLKVVLPASKAGSHVRAELRIQDGCDAHCTFCIIPKIRKTLRSKTIGDTVMEAERLVQLGHPEIVLTGIFLGAYGHETALRRNQPNPGAKPLADLLDAVAQIPGLQRLRLSSMEPGDVSEELLDAMVANAPVVVPHLHLPLQSGSDAVLRRMNRQYRVNDYLEMIGQINQALTTSDGLPPAITTDIICGFPRESDADFQQTFEIAEQVGYLHMHVFPYSARSGTAAARWTDQHLAPSILKKRVGKLLELESDPESGLSITYRRRLLGRSLRVILEQPDKDDPGLMTGRSDHYALIHIPTDLPRGTVCNVNITRLEGVRTMGELAPTNHPLSILR